MKKEDRSSLGKTLFIQKREAQDHISQANEDLEAGGLSL